MLKGNLANGLGRHINAINPRRVPGNRTNVKSIVLMGKLGQGSPVRSKYQLLHNKSPEKFG